MSNSCHIAPRPLQAANKEKAVAAAVEASDAAVERGDKFLVTKIDVGLDSKALQVGRRVDSYCKLLGGNGGRRACVCSGKQ